MSNNFGDNLKKYRIQNKIGINELGRKIGVSGAYISSLEAGKKQNPSFDIINKLSEVLNISPILLTYENDSNIFDKFNQVVDKKRLNDQLNLINSKEYFFKSLGYDIEYSDGEIENGYFVKINNIKYTYSQYTNLLNLIKSCIDNINEILKNNN